jgi:hypothetical protein
MSTIHIPPPEAPAAPAPPPGKPWYRTRKILIPAGALVVLGGAAAGAVIALSGGSSLTASPDQINKLLVGHTVGSPLPVFQIKHVQVNGTPVDNGTTETADITITWGYIPGVSGPPQAPTHDVLTLNDRTRAWSYVPKA